MSSAVDLRRAGEQRAAPSPAGRRLTVVPGRSRTLPRVPFAALVVLTLAFGVVGLLLLNTSLQHGAFRAAALSSQATALLDRQQDLELRVAALRSPHSVAERARRLGMVPNPDPVFLRLSDGRVLGRPQPAPPAAAPVPTSPDGLR